MSGAEVVAAISLISSIANLLDFGAKVVHRLNEFRDNVQDLPEAFRHIGAQLPLLLETADRLQAQAHAGTLSGGAREALVPVIEGLREQVGKLDRILQRILPAEGAKRWERAVKAVKSLAVQRDVEELSSLVQSYVFALTVYQTTRNGDLIGLLFDKVVAGGSLVSAVPDAKKPIFMVGYERDENFIGRNDVMADVKERFKRMRRVALAGIGGVGKSRIAIEYSYACREQDPSMHIFWVNGGTKAKFEASYQKIANSLGLKNPDDHIDDMKGRIRDWLSDEANGRWFMVLDNADDRDVWFPSSTHKAPDGHAAFAQIEYLPRGEHGRILVTTRDSQLGQRLLEGTNKPIDILRFAPKEARELLEVKLADGTGLTREDAEELVSALEYLPLTINQAAAYLDQIGVNASEYLELLRAGQSDIPQLLLESIDDPTRDRQTSNSVFQTWRISFEQISRQSPRAAEILSLMAMLDRQSIPKALLYQPGEGPLQLQAALAKLKAFSLVEEHQDLGRYSLHRLVQLSTQMWLEQIGQLSTWQEAAVFAVSSGLPPVADYENWSAIRDLYPHAELVLSYEVVEPLYLLQRADILQLLGHYAMHQSHMGAACRYLQEAVAIRTQALGQANENTMTSKSLLGTVYGIIGQVKESQRLHEEVLREASRVLGPNHKLTLKCMSRHAITLNKQGDFKTCAALQKDVLARMQQVLGVEHPDALIEMGNLTYSLIKLDQFEAAEQLAVEALSLRTQVLGKEHPDTLTAMANVAWALEKQKRFKESEQLYEQLLEMRTTVLGDEHPKTWQTRSFLARVQRLQGRSNWTGQPKGEWKGRHRHFDSTTTLVNEGSELRPETSLPIRIRKRRSTEDFASGGTNEGHKRARSRDDRHYSPK